MFKNKWWVTNENFIIALHLVRTPLWNNQNDFKTNGKCTYFAQIDYILVLAALTRAVGWKSTAMREISTHTICFPVHKSMPSGCPNPQPSVVKNRSYQKKFFEIPNHGVFIEVEKVIKKNMGHFMIFSLWFL